MSEWIRVEDGLPDPDEIAVWRYSDGTVTLYQRGDDPIIGMHEPPLTHWAAIPDPLEGHDG